MADISFDCPACSSAISPEEVLVALAHRGTAEELLEDQADVEMNCPECGTEITLRASEAIVKLSADDAVLAVFKRLAEEGDEFVHNRRPNFDDIVEREREARERRRQLNETLEELRDSL